MALLTIIFYYDNIKKRSEKMKKPIVLLFELIANVIDNRALSEEDIKALKDDDILKKTLKINLNLKKSNCFLCKHKKV